MSDSGRETSTPSAAMSRHDGPGASSPAPLAALKEHLRRDKVTRLALLFLDANPQMHLKDLVADEMDDRRRISIEGKWLWNFGSDSFLGLDRDPRIQHAIVDALPRWGSHNGASRAFCSVALCEAAERRLARWLGVADTLIYPSVTLANAGLLPAVVRRGDLLIVDRRSHDSLQQAAHLAAATGATVCALPETRGDTIRELVRRQRGQRCVLAIDGVYSMTGQIPPLGELHETVTEVGGVLYVDDAHGTGVVGPGGRGATYAALGGLDDVLMVGSLSKGFSALGAFVTCEPELKRILKIRSSSFIFGGPVPPPYLAAVCAVCDLLESPEGQQRLQTLRQRIAQLTAGLLNLGLRYSGGIAPIISVQIGELEQTLAAGRWLFDRGYYVQSATYPAVPITSGLLRIQVNANHPPEAIDGLLGALADLSDRFDLPKAAA